MYRKVIFVVTIRCMSVIVFVIFMSSYYTVRIHIGLYHLTVFIKLLKFFMFFEHFSFTYSFPVLVL